MYRLNLNKLIIYHLHDPLRRSNSEASVISSAYMQKAILDFHIHSRFSRACSKELTFFNIAKWCQIKGVNIVGSGDFTHSAWIKEFEDSMKSNGDGLYSLKSGEYSDVYFVLSTELSCIYKKNGKVRRIHVCILMSSIDSVKKFNQELVGRGKNLKSDGRPILGMDVIEVLQIALAIDNKSLIIPAHIWTPWFSALGLKSGFDSIEECFEEYLRYIFAVETGLSSDPKMNWRLSSLDNYLCVSNSDAHSLENIGREANVIMLEKFSYNEIYNIFKNKDKNKFLFTIEFYPQEGTYYNDGHRKCKINLDPKKSTEQKNICPVCKKELTRGVLHRIEELSDRNEEEIEKLERDNYFIPFINLIGLKKIISESFRVGRNSKRVDNLYFEMIKKFGNEFNILLNVSFDELKCFDYRIADAIKRVRENKVNLIPGYDGEYGKINIFSESEINKFQKE